MVLLEKTYSNLRELVFFALLACLVAALLLSDWTVSAAAPDAIRSLALEARSIGQDPQTQWMVVLCLVAYFVTILVLELRLGWPLYSRWWDQPSLWLAALVALGLFHYALAYETAAHTSHWVGLLTGVVAGRGVAAWMCWPWDFKGSEDAHAASGGRNVRVGTARKPTGWEAKATALLVFLVFLLAGVALWQPAYPPEFVYRGVRRWSGLWRNPNTYGLLMGVGTVLAVGAIVSRLVVRRPTEMRWLKSASDLRFCSKFSLVRQGWAWLPVILCGVAGVICALGLLMSFSRGAWLGTSVGLAYLVWKLRESSLAGSRVTQPAAGAFLRRHRWAFVALVVSTVIITFWQFRDTEWRPARRAFSVVNLSDFSWRNRVAAWEGALQMIAERPWTGFGWKLPETLGHQFYSQPRLVEGLPLHLNDYLMLGAAMGIPGLACFLGATALSLGTVPGRRQDRSADSDGEKSRKDIAMASGQSDRQTFILKADPQVQNLQATCQSGVLVLLVGFWFGGGLFELASSFLFWLLLECGRKMQSVTLGGPEGHAG